jgi:signal-transduction protein with cAMP-binding, CBS, and nucleotidyltransferase domain
MDRTTVADRMSAPVLTLAAETPIDEAAAGMLETEIKSLVVIDDDCAPAGIFTSTDIVELAAADGRPSDATVGDYMTTDVVTTDPETTLAAAAERLVAEEINHLPVTEDGDVVGMLSTTDLTERVAEVEAADGPV